MGFGISTTRGRPSTFTTATVNKANERITEWRESANVGDSLTFAEEPDTFGPMVLGGEPDTFGDTLLRSLGVAFDDDGEPVDVPKDERAEAKDEVDKVRGRITRALDVAGINVLPGTDEHTGEPTFGVLAVALPEPDEEPKAKATPKNKAKNKAKAKNK